MVQGHSLLGEAENFSHTHLHLSYCVSSFEKENCEFLHSLNKSYNFILNYSKIKIKLKRKWILFMKMTIILLTIIKKQTRKSKKYLLALFPKLGRETERTKPDTVIIQAIHV